MARDTTGSQGQPGYSGAGASADAADLTELGNYAALVGNRKTGPTTLRNTVTGTDVWEGLLWGDTTDKAEYKYVSGAWVQVFKPGNQPFATATGTGTSPVNAYSTITFPTGRFTVAPLVFITTYGTNAGTGHISSATTTSASVGIFTGSGGVTSLNFYWTAVQMTATTAAG